MKKARVGISEWLRISGNIYEPMKIYLMYSDQSYTWLLIGILSLETFHAEYADKTLQ